MKSRRAIGIIMLILFIPMWLLDMLMSWLMCRRVDPLGSLIGTWISWKIAYWY